MTNLISNGWCKQSVTGITLLETPSFNQWDKAIYGMAIVIQATPFVTGDLINIGQETFGEDFSQATRHFPEKKSGTLSNYASVCRKVPIENRREELSFSAHAAVSKLSTVEQLKWLDHAIQNGWGSSEIREAIKENETIEIEQLETGPEGNKKERKEERKFYNRLLQVYDLLSTLPNLSQDKDQTDLVNKAIDYIDDAKIDYEAKHGLQPR